MFHFKFFSLSTSARFKKITLKETCLPCLDEGFKNEIEQYDDKSFELSHFLKNRYSKETLAVSPFSRHESVLISTLCK